MITSSTVPSLGQTEETRVLDSTPRVLCVHRLVADHGAKFEWDSSGARLTLNGQIHQLPVQRGVPLLALPCIQRTSGMS